MHTEVLALPRGLGRPVVVRVWRDAARSSLVAPVRRPRMARARADGCRLIRRGAEGLGNPAGAGALGGQEHTGGKGGAVSCGSVSRASRPRGAPRGASGRCPPVVAALAGAGDWPVAHAAPAPRGRGRPAAAPRRARHALPRPALRGQGTGPRRALAVAAGPRAGARCRRDKPAPGPRPPPAGPADAAGHG